MLAGGGDSFAMFGELLPESRAREHVSNNAAATDTVQMVAILTRRVLMRDTSCSKYIASEA